jgi:adenosylmethionine-8-amino-7-oxononanoate aminotransferase
VSTLSERDQAVLWHPATHFGDLERTPPLAIDSARGVWLYEHSGRRILDGIGSWWTSIHGHGHPHIVAAIQQQAARLDHVMFAGFTHEPAVELAERLLALAPSDAAVRYGKVFYSDCGSAAVEVALKLSFQARVQRGEAHRRKFAALQRSYHGETLGALSVCGSADWREPFSPLLSEPLYLPAPAFIDHEHGDLAGHHDHGGRAELGADTPQADAAVALLEAHAGELSACVIEPLIQCAGRMSMPGVGYYRRLIDVCRRLDIHVIADEIAVGFGRTGKLFASEWVGRAPDLLCLSKGLSGGVLPLAATLIRAGFEDDFKGDPGRSFAHSHTFTGNPITCAAARASLEVFESEQTLAALPERIACMTALRRTLADRHPQILDSRQAGFVAALTVDRGRGPADGRLSLALRAAALARGVLLRPLLDTIYWMPALNIEIGALEQLAAVTSEVIDEVLPR